jgi:(2Fe-2S) ferredoxin
LNVCVPPAKEPCSPIGSRKGPQRSVFSSLFKLNYSIFEPNERRGFAAADDGRDVEFCSPHHDPIALRQLLHALADTKDNTQAAAGHYIESPQEPEAPIARSPGVRADRADIRIKNFPILPPKSSGFSDVLRFTSRRYFAKWYPFDNWDTVTPLEYIFIGQLRFDMTPHEIAWMVRTLGHAVNIYEVAIKTGVCPRDPTVVQPKGCCRVLVDTADVPAIITRLHDQHLCVEDGILSGSPESIHAEYDRRKGSGVPRPLVCERTRGNNTSE